MDEKCLVITAERCNLPVNTYLYHGGLSGGTYEVREGDCDMTEARVW